MRDWNIKIGDPRSLTLVADARLCTPDYFDDQIWELSLGGGEPPALALQTTYGLRARSMRLFPRFFVGDTTISDPEDYALPPAIRNFYPNFLVVAYSPLPGLEVQAEYWVPNSHSVAGRLKVANKSTTMQEFRLEWVALLAPSEDGKPMVPVEIQGATALAGITNGLHPVVFLTGGAVTASGPYPALAIGLELPPGGARQLIWSHTALTNQEESFHFAREIAARNWEAERARLELLNNGQVEITTGDADWDAAFALTQKVALSLFLGPTPHLPFASFVHARHTGHGYSLRGDGSDYGHQWNGQSPHEAYALVRSILPAAPDLAKGLLYNFLHTHTDDGAIDWKPGLGGQRSNLQATPVLATMAWSLYQASGDCTFLEQVYPQLISFVHAWFTLEHDRDGDGIPEWDHPIQAGFDDHPLFARWHTWAHGVDITTAESPSLCAFLYHECVVLAKIAKLVGHEEAIPALQAFADNLRTAVEASWDPSTNSYSYWDRESHLSPSGGAIAEHLGAGELTLNMEFEEPVRLLLRIRSSGESTRRPLVFVHGVSPSGQHRVERMTADYFQWYLGWGTATSSRTYRRIESIELQGLEPDDLVDVQAASFKIQDHTLLLPLWAGIPDRERAHALVAHTITNEDRYWRPFGIPACPELNSPEEANVCNTIHMIWNNFIGEGLLRYGYREQAAQLISRLMAAVVDSLRKDGAFRRYYHPDTGLGIGERDTISGLAPLALFLDTLGVRLISPDRVTLEGNNPFPWPVTVKYRGLTVLRQKDKTLVIFPDGQTVTVTDSAPCTISME